MSVVVDGVLGPLPLVRHTRGCPCFSIVPEAMHEASRGPLKEAVSAEKPFKGVGWRRGRCWEELQRIVFSQLGIIDFPSRQINDFFYKKET